MRVGGAHGALIGAAGDRRRGRQQPDPARAAAGHGELGGGRDDADHVDIRASGGDVLLERLERRRAGGVARDHQQLRAGFQQMVGDLDRELLELLLRPGAVREPCGIAEVQVVLGRAVTPATRGGRSGRPRQSRIRRRGPLGSSGHRRGWCQSGGRIRSQPVRALIVTNMYPTPEQPALGSFVRDQVQALRTDRRGRRRGLRVRARRSRRIRARRAVPATRLPRRAVRRRPRPLRTTVSGPSLARRARARAVTLHGTDLSHPRSRAITLAGLRTMDLVGDGLRGAGEAGPACGLAGPRAVLPIGVDIERFHPISRAARALRAGARPRGPLSAVPR